MTSPGEQLTTVVAICRFIQLGVTSPRTVAEVKPAKTAVKNARPNGVDCSMLAAVAPTQCQKLLLKYDFACFNLGCIFPSE